MVSMVLLSLKRATMTGLLCFLTWYSVLISLSIHLLVDRPGGFFPIIHRHLVIRKERE